MVTTTRKKDQAVQQIVRQNSLGGTLLPKRTTIGEVLDRGLDTVGDVVRYLEAAAGAHEAGILTNEGGRTCQGFADKLLKAFHYQQLHSSKNPEERLKPLRLPGK